MLKPFLIIGIFSLITLNTKQEIIGTWEFDYNQTIYNCDGEKVDYLKSKKENGETTLTFKTDLTFTGEIWGSKYFGEYIIKDDTVWYHSDSPALEGVETELIIGEIQDTLLLASFTCDKKDTLRYLRKK